MNTFGAQPLALLPERAWRTYQGGSLLDRLQGMESGGDGHFPEEWIMSVVEARNAGRETVAEGLSRLASDPAVTLRDVVRRDPAAILGVGHVNRFGPTPGVLVKLIDSSERLTIQVHPDREQAMELFRSDYGKTECWHILGGRTIHGEAPCVYLGFKDGMTRKAWTALFEKQDIPGMLNALHRFDVQPGETILVEGGVPHAIGAGCFLVEIQEPTDYTIRTERTTPSGFALADCICHQGLGFDRMFECFDYRGVTREEARTRWFVEPETLLHHGEDMVVSLMSHKRCGYFRLDRIQVADALAFNAPGVFSGIYVLDGEGHLRSGGAAHPLRRGTQYFLSAAMGDFVVDGAGNSTLNILRFFGPSA